jgi:hypothetical protein
VVTDESGSNPQESSLDNLHVPAAEHAESVTADETIGMSVYI